MSAWHRSDVEKSALEHLTKVVGPKSARQIVDGLIAKGQGAGLLEAADLIDNNDTCDCGGCDTCIPRRLANIIRTHAKGGEPR